MSTSGQVWPIILAAGEGERLRSLTVTHQGVTVPKQYCAFDDSRSLLEATLARAERLAPRERIVVVVAGQHERWWGPARAHLPRRNVIVQPQNRGTAPGLLLPLMHVLARDPDATVAVLPSDHHIEDEEALDGSFSQALAAARGEDEPVVLLGITPDAADAGYGWIVPGARSGADGTRAVAAFVEKPTAEVARRLLDEGALWSSFLFASSLHGLIDQFMHALPSLTKAFLLYLTGEGEARQWAVEALYQMLPGWDFSRDVLEQAPEGSLRVLPVPRCGWSDLGTPERLAGCLRRRDRRRARPAASPPAEALVPDLGRLDPALL